MSRKTHQIDQMKSEEFLFQYFHLQLCVVFVVDVVVDSKNHMYVAITMVMNYTLPNDVQMLTYVLLLNH